MATDDSAIIIPLHQPKRPKTGAERARAYRQRKKEAGEPVDKLAANSVPVAQPPQQPVTPAPAPAVTPVTAVPAVTSRASVTKAVTRAVTSRRWPVTSILLNVAALVLAAVGVTMNGWFAHTMGASDTAGWLFVGIGVAADLVALAVPSCAAVLWSARQRGAALAGWALWVATFAFTVSSGIGFAAVNLSDVTASRASRSTPAIVTAQTALDDAKASRDRECRGGVGRFCREREAAVAERQQALAAAQRTVEQAADPQTEAASRIVAWLSAGTLRPSGDDIAMLRLILLAMLPQVGGVLMMVGRPPK